MYFFLYLFGWQCNSNVYVNIVSITHFNHYSMAPNWPVVGLHAATQP